MKNVTLKHTQALTLLLQKYLDRELQALGGSTQDAVTPRLSLLVRQGYRSSHR